MPDYGHDLRFGVFITPTNQDPLQPVELAVTAERAGLDLVTYQDHPYQPAFHDTWTLLSYVAARTERVRLAGNVHNLPLRQPAVLARAAASLDLLSGGRFELGLGAGAFWDAIAAMGGRRLEPGQSVDALAQAIDVIRGIWDVADRTRLRAGGELHHVDGAKRGPAPAHPIEIWLGAYRPWMLRLVGRAADGWLPTIVGMPLDKIAANNAIIDEAADAAGRDSGAIRRIGNVAEPEDRPRDKWVEELARLTLDHGFSTYVLQTDDADQIMRYGREVAPAVRETVASVRTGTRSEG